MIYFCHKHVDNRKTKHGNEDCMLADSAILIPCILVLVQCCPNHDCSGIAISGFFTKIFNKSKQKQNQNPQRFGIFLFTDMKNVLWVGLVCKWHSFVYDSCSRTEINFNTKERFFAPTFEIMEQKWSSQELFLKPQTRYLVGLGSKTLLLDSIT